MSTKTIEFSVPEEYLISLEKEDYPIPTKLNIPEWIKNLNHSHNNQTIKGCMPFLDTLTSGYILKMPQDFYLEHNVENTLGKKDTFYKFAMYDKPMGTETANLNSSINVCHSKDQLKGSPYVEKNKGMAFHKIMNPWLIKTTPGYSCLFVPPLNNSDDRFSIIPGIVDTDVLNQEINFPIVINGDKYPSLITTIPKGLPYVQIIPFKRDSWEMKVSKTNTLELKSGRFFNNLRLINNYKNKFWHKKSWK